MRTKIVATLLILLLAVQGCEYLGESEFEAKSFRIRTELRSGDGIEVLTWENATDLEFNEEEYVYRFKVDGKLVLLDPRGTVVVEEQ